MSQKIRKTDEEWKHELSPEAFRILRQKDTERPFSGEYVHNKEKGVYRCAGCGAELFGSEEKFDSGCGWPSFYDPLTKDQLELRLDTSHFMTRTEVLCAKCEGHLGHVFDDGPAPTGKRYCINSASLRFDKSKKK